MLAEQVLTALGDRRRRQLLRLVIRWQPVPASRLYAEFDTTAPAVSKHLRILREAKLVRVEARGSQRLYSLNEAGFRAAREWLDGYLAYWNQQLDKLEQHLARKKGTV